MKNTPDSTALIKSHTEAIACILPIDIYIVVEKGMEHKGEQR